MLYSQARRIHWCDLFDAQHGFLVESLGARRGGRRHAAEAGHHAGAREHPRRLHRESRAAHRRSTSRSPGWSWWPISRNGRCMLSLDTSGKSLHKRGYREPGHPAPLKETLAAAILIMAGYDGTPGLPGPDVRQRHARDRGCDDGGAQGATDPPQEGRVLLRMAEVPSIARCGARRRIACVPRSSRRLPRRSSRRTSTPAMSRWRRRARSRRASSST